MNSRKIFAALVAVAFFYVSSPLILPVAMGGVIAALFSPWLNYLEKKKIKPALASSVLTFAITIVLILPASLLLFYTVKAGFSQLQQWRSSDTEMDVVDRILQTPRIKELLAWLSDRFSLNTADLVSGFRDFYSGTGGKLAEVLGGIITHLPGIFLTVAIVVVSVYFFLVDGKKLVSFFQKNTVFTHHQTNRMMEIVVEMSRSVILASLISGLIQALLEVIACIFTRTSNTALIGLSVFIGSFIPIVGSAPITFGIALEQFLEGKQYESIVLFVSATIIIAADNAVRPLFLRGAANLHPLIAFIAAFGGLQTIGFSGVFLGPILASLFVITVKILLQGDSPQISRSGN